MGTISEQIIQRYCNSIEERVLACCDENVAECLKQCLCSEIKRDCNSDIVVQFVQRYVDNLIQARFSSKRN